MEMTAKATHTPRPFAVGASGIKVKNPRASFIQIKDLSGGTIALVVVGSGHEAANANLLAAAPRLLAACERCLAALAANDAPNCEAAKEARAAIAKATWANQTNH